MTASSINDCMEAATQAERRRILAVLDRLEADAHDRVAVAAQPPAVQRMLDHYVTVLNTLNTVREEVAKW